MMQSHFSKKKGEKKPEMTLNSGIFLAEPSRIGCKFSVINIRSRFLARVGAHFTPKNLRLDCVTSSFTVNNGNCEVSSTLAVTSPQAPPAERKRYKVEADTT